MPLNMHKPAIRKNISYEDKRSRNSDFFRSMRTNQEMYRRMPNWQNGFGLNQNERHPPARILNDHPALPFYNGWRKNNSIVNKPNLSLPSRANCYQNMSSEFVNRRESEPYKSVRISSSRGKKHFPNSKRFNDRPGNYSRHQVRNFTENQNYGPMQKNWYRDDVDREMQRNNKNKQNAYTRNKDFERHQYIEYPKCRKCTKFERNGNRISPKVSYGTKEFFPQSYYDSQNGATNHTKVHNGEHTNSVFYADNPRKGTNKGISPRSNYYEYISYKWPSYSATQYAPRENCPYGNQDAYDHYDYQREAIWTSPKNHFNPNWIKTNDCWRNNPNNKYCQPEAEFHKTMKINEAIQPTRGFKAYQMNGYVHKMSNGQHSDNEYQQVRFPNTQGPYANRDNAYYYRNNRKNYILGDYKNNSNPKNDKWVDEPIRIDNATDFITNNHSILSKIHVPNVLAKNKKPFNSNEEKERILNKQRKSPNVLPDVNGKENVQFKNDVQSSEKNEKKEENFGSKENKMKKKTTTINDSSSPKDLSCDPKPPCVSNNFCESQTNQAEATKFELHNELITIKIDSPTSNEERSYTEINKELLSSSLVECSEENDQKTDSGIILKDEEDKVKINFSTGEKTRTEEEMLKEDNGNNLLRKEIIAKEDSMENCCSFETDGSDIIILNDLSPIGQNNSPSMLGDHHRTNLKSLEKSSEHTDLAEGISFESDKLPLRSIVDASNSDSKSTPDVAETKHKTKRIREHQATPFPRLNKRSSDPSEQGYSKLNDSLFKLG